MLSHVGGSITKTNSTEVRNKTKNTGLMPLFVFGLGWTDDQIGCGNADAGMTMTCLPTMGLLSPVASVVIGQPFCQGQTGVKHAERARAWQANRS